MRECFHFSSCEIINRKKNFLNSFIGADCANLIYWFILFVLKLLSKVIRKKWKTILTIKNNWGKITLFKTSSSNIFPILYLYLYLFYKQYVYAIPSSIFYSIALWKQQVALRIARGTVSLINIILLLHHLLFQVFLIHLIYFVIYFLFFVFVP